MEAQCGKVEKLKKVSLSIEAGTRPDHMDLISSPLSLEFVFGLGVEGLSPLEFELSDRSVGETFVLSLDRGRLNGLFGHIPVHLPVAGDEEGRLYLRIRVEGVTAADEMEIIRAMAENASCGGDCCGH